MLTYNRDMEAAKEASAEDRIILLVPTGDPSAPVSVELGHWDDSLGRFEGEWRHIAVPDADPLQNFAEADPIAWCRVPPISDDLLEYVLAVATKKAA